MRIKNPKAAAKVPEQTKAALDGFFQSLAAKDTVTLAEMRSYFNKTVEQWPDGRIHQLLIDVGYGDLVEVG